MGVGPDAQVEPVAEQRAVVNRFVAAFERADVAELTALLADDVVLEMPPMWNWYRGTDDFSAFMRRVFRTRGEEWRTVPLWANGEAGFAADASRALPTLSILTLGAGKGTRLTLCHGEAGVEPFALVPVNR